jgi:F plasmid transfer operon protein TraF
MRRAFTSIVSLACFAIISAPRVARAQADDTVGTRAQGMAGAFTAVADDASATWWNPAGLASGAYFNGIIEAGTHHQPGTERTATGAPVPAWRAEDRAVSVAFPALGLSYYRLRVSEIRPETPIGTAAADRQDEGSADTRLRTLTLDQFGASVGQSLGQHLVVGSTLKLVSGRFGASVRSPGTASLDEADRLETDGETHADLDIGAMANLGHVRLGVMVRNVREPAFRNGMDTVTLQRHARAGFALTSGGRGVLGQATIAVDADLMKTTAVFGDERRVAVGGEVWTSKRILGIRGGLSANTIGSRRLSPSGGVSAALRQGMYVDGEVTGGSEEGRHGWGLALRVTF